MTELETGIRDINNAVAKMQVHQQCKYSIIPPLYVMFVTDVSSTA